MLTVHEQSINETYRNQANTFGHMCSVLEVRNKGARSESAWRCLADYGNQTFGTFRIRSNSGPVYPETLSCYFDARQAAAIMQDLKRNYDSYYSYRIKRYPLPQEAAEALEAQNTWKAREASRFTDGTYTPLPWADEAWFKDKHDRLQHFAHVSTEDPGKIAFTSSNEAGARDLQTRIAPGRYLNEYYGHELCNVPRKETGAVNVLGEKVMISPLEYYARTFRKQYGGGDTLHFATTGEEMVEVYENGPDSCMASCASEYASNPHHPVEVYAAGDLQLAYLKDAQGNITARALVWPEKKLVGRPYGDDMALIAALEEQGYARPDWSSLNGARLLKIPHRGGYVMPFIDGGQRYDEHPDGKHFKIGGNCSAGNTNGLDRRPDEGICDHCGDYTDLEDLAEVEVRRNHTELWCPYCVEHDAAPFEDEGETIANLAAYRRYYVRDGNGVWWRPDNLPGASDQETESEQEAA